MPRKSKFTWEEKIVAVNLFWKEGRPTVLPMSLAFREHHLQVEAGV